MKALFAAAVAALFCTAPVSAAVRVFNFTARVNVLSPSTTGMTFTGNFSYDDEAEPTYYEESADETYAIYEHPSLTLTANFAGQTFSGADRASVQDVREGADTDEGDSFYIGTSSGRYYLQLAIHQPDRLWLNNSRLPGFFPSSLWQDSPGSLSDDENELTVPHGDFYFIDLTNGRGFGATVLSVTPANAGAVPEPATWAMLIAGFGLIGAALRRRVVPAAGALAA